LMIGDQAVEQSHEPRNSHGPRGAPGDVSVPMLLPECDQVANASGPFGTCVTNPIPVNGIQGEIIYLNRLRAPSKCRFFFHRTGSYLPRTYPQMVDAYELLSLDGRYQVEVFLAPHHPRRSQFVPEGLHRTSWKRMNKMERFLAKVQIFGRNTFVRNFPWGLAESIRSDPPVRGLPPRTVEEWAQTVSEAANRIPRQKGPK
jgi:hypothetical protein